MSYRASVTGFDSIESIELSQRILDATFYIYKYLDELNPKKTKDHVRMKIYNPDTEHISDVLFKVLEDISFPEDYTSTIYIYETHEHRDDSSAVLSIQKGKFVELEVYLSKFYLLTNGIRDRSFKFKFWFNEEGNSIRAINRTTDRSEHIYIHGKLPHEELEEIKLDRVAIVKLEKKYPQINVKDIIKKYSAYPYDYIQRIDIDNADQIIHILEEYKNMTEYKLSQIASIMENSFTRKMKK
jgi:hypothetical protein